MRAYAFFSTCLSTYVSRSLFAARKNNTQLFPRRLFWALPFYVSGGILAAIVCVGCVRTNTACWKFLSYFALALAELHHHDGVGGFVVGSIPNRVIWCNVLCDCND